MSQVQLSEELSQLLLTQTIDLPIFHPIALKLQRMLSKNDFTVNDVAEIASEDQSLATQILRISNSPVYMGRNKVATIKEAITRLGAKQVMNIAFAASQASAHVSEDPLLSSCMDELWMHSHGSAIGARWLACERGLGGMAEETYLAALLHDVGKLYLLKSLEELLKVGKIASIPDKDTIMQIFDTMHVEHGYRLMQGAGLPQMYCDITRDHHLEEVDPVNKILVIVRFINNACHKFGLGLKREPELDLLLTRESELLYIGEMQIAELEPLLLESTLWSRSIT